MSASIPQTAAEEAKAVLHTKPYHLSYCTNIHPGESWEAVAQSLKEYVPAIKKSVCPHQWFGLGLRLSDQASLELLQELQLQQFKNWLEAEKLYIFTLNGFPYGGFHHQVVKDQVHYPDWTSTERLHYTLRLFDILAALLPDGLAGGISTSPLSYKYWHRQQKDKQAVYEHATQHLLQVAEHLYRLREKTGQWLHLDIEPEPDGMLENSEEVVNYFQDWLLAKGVPYLQRRLGITAQQAGAAITNHLQLCYDVCHFALAYEKPQAVFAKMENAGIRIGKIQISAALKSKLPTGFAAREQLFKRYSPFAESTYLHQVVARLKEGGLHHYPDLPAALQDIQNPALEEWRTHFHVPVFESSYGQLESTQDDIMQVLELMKIKPLSEHLEVETYTWEVLPPQSRLPLAESIVRELQWVQQRLDC